MTASSVVLNITQAHQYRPSSPVAISSCQSWAISSLAEIVTIQSAGAEEEEIVKQEVLT
jgi:hypothetical protein